MYNACQLVAVRMVNDCPCVQSNVLTFRKEGTMALAELFGFQELPCVAYLLSE